MKRPFEEIVEENADWIYRYVRSKTADRETAEDLAQEVWLRAFRAYDTYEERGMLRHWLARIASNIVRNALFGRPDIVVFSLDAAEEDEDPILTRLADREIPDPLDEVERREMIASVLSAIDSLPDKYRQVMTFRFLMDLPVDEVARRMNIPAGSVKSSTHYAIERIRRDLGIPEKEKGETTMTCEKAKNYLFMYAKGKLSPERRAQVAEHLASCPHCRGIEESLEELIPHIEFKKEVPVSHFLVNIEGEAASYAGAASTWDLSTSDRFKEINKTLADHGGNIPEDELTLGLGGHGKSIKLTAVFINEGEECGFEVCAEDEFHEYEKMTYCPRIYPYFEQYFSYTGKLPKAREERNDLGCDGYTALYRAVPRSRGVPKIKQGNGVIITEKGDYNFAYAARYVCGDETCVLRYEFE
ncbi:MAG: sigma-70 family RNA polymerase sigma factor [Clostridia bacterium]|nr:sigma-70 family RNA polymerase sigma factor [Clostridia bacterium]